jgi:hypothetical protein
LQSFRVDQELDAFSSDGKKQGIYIVTNINEKDDRIELKNKETSDLKTIDFAFQGIPLEEPFSILRIVPTETKFEEPEPEETEPEEEIEEIELPDIVRVETIESKERVYPELTQKSDFKEDLLSFINPASQKNPLVIRRIRTLVEQFSALKNSILKRGLDGVIIGEEKIILNSIYDLLLNHTIPIVRPVLETKRIIITERPREIPEDLDQILIRRLDTIISNSTEYLNSLGGISRKEEGIPVWFQALNNYFKRYPLGDEYSSGYSFKEDGEYFRNSVPGSKDLEGLVKLMDFYGDGSPSEYVGKIDQSLRRGHGPTVRGLEKGGTEIIMTGDQAPVKGYVLFPYRVVSTGSIGGIKLTCID